MSAGSIVIDLLMRTGAFETDTKRAEKALASFKRQATDHLQAAAIAAGVLGTAMLYMAKETIDAMDQMNAAAQKTGITVEMLSQLGYAAKMSNVETEAFTQSMVKFNRTIAEAQSGTGDAAEAFKALGISQKDLRSMNPSDLLLQTADGFAKYADGANKTALAVALFGRSGADLIPLLNEGSAGINAMREEADKLGATMSTSAAVAADQFNDNVDKMIVKMKSFVKSIVSEVIPTLNVLMETFLAGNSLMNVIDAGMNLNLEGGSVGVGQQLARAELQLREADERDKARLKAKVDAYRSAYTAIRKMEGGATSATDKQAGLPQAPSINKPKTSKGAADEGAAFLKGLQERIEKAGKGEIALLRLVAAEKEVGAAAEPLIQQLIEANWAQGADKFTEALGRSNDALQLQIDLVGKSSREAEILTMTQRVNADLQERINDLIRENGRVSEETAGKMRAAAQATIDAQTNLINKRYEKSYSAVAGAERFFNEIETEATNSAQMTYEVFSNAFDGMADSLASFIVTGKADFQSLANSIVMDITRMIIKIQMFNLLKSMGAGDSGGGFLGSLGSALFGGASSVPMSSGSLPFGNAGGATIAASGGGLFFASGGYTGDGGKFEPAGIVHKGEYVMNSESTNRIGVSTLNRMNRGYATGGLVTAGMAAAPATSNVVVNVTPPAGSSRQSALQWGADAGKAISRAMARNT